MASKRKAIERAWKCDCDEQGCTAKYYPEVAAERGYDAGRIAGLREAARLRSVNGRSAGGSISVSRDAIKDHADKLAKKARKNDAK